MYLKISKKTLTSNNANEIGIAISVMTAGKSKIVELVLPTSKES